MGIPLPKVIPDVGPGGPLLSAMGAVDNYANALNQSRYNKVKADYADMTIPAQAMSQMAYARFMYPQFMAKLMADKGYLGNTTEEQKANNIQTLQNAANGQVPGGNIFNNIPGGQGDQNTSKSANVFNKFLDLLGLGQDKGQEQQQPNNTFNNPMPQQSNNAFNNPMPQPGIASNVPEDQQEDGYNPNTMKALDAWHQTPQGKAAAERLGDNYMPDNLMNWWNKQQGNPPNTGKPSYAENTAKYEGIQKEGEASGGIRAKNIEELNNSVFNAETNQATLDEISDILASPEFEEIRNTPLAGKHELAYYAKEGKPAQQQMVGRYYTLTGDVIKNASRDFAGQFRQGEQSLLQSMKAGPGDTVDSAKGKTEALSVLNQMLAARSRETSKLMSQYHIDKLQASEMADKKINGQQIRKDVHAKLNPNPSDDEIDFTAKKHGMTRQQVIDRLKQEGRYNE